MKTQQIRNNAKYNVLDNKLYDYVQQLVVDNWYKKINTELAVQTFYKDNIDDFNEVCKELNLGEDLSLLIDCMKETANVANHRGE